MTDPLGQSQVLPYIINIDKKKYKFHLISFEKRTRFKQNKSQIQNICDKNNISWRPLIYTKNPPLFSTLWDLVKLNQSIKKIGSKTTFDIIHCRSYLPAIFGLKFKKKWNVKMLFDMRGFWADERVEGGLWNLKNPIYKLVYKYF